jgi:DNA-binding beta-propeller fold protein YncE
MKNAAKLALLLSAWALSAQAQPRFEVDPTWPKPLPERWIFAQIGGVCVDSHDHIAIVDRSNITDEEKQTNVPTPTFVMFDRAGKVVNSWGDLDVVPADVHGCSFDEDDNLWVAGNEDAIVQGYSHEGELILQIGTKGVFDTTDGSVDAPFTNQSRERLNRPSGAVVDPDTGDIYVSDGYGNKRVVVFDSEGNYLRQWGSHATAAERAAATPGTFANVVHCIEMSNEGLLYVCDRQGSRVQVFDKMGNHIRDIHIPRTDDFVEPEPVVRGTAWWVTFSPDEAQGYLYVMNGAEEKVHVLDHESGETLSTFGRAGHLLGNFIHGHTIATDSSGNLYVAETNYGRRVQRFNLVSN